MKRAVFWKNFWIVLVEWILLVTVIFSYFPYFLNMWSSSKGKDMPSCSSSCFDSRVNTGTIKSWIGITQSSFSLRSKKTRQLWSEEIIFLNWSTVFSVLLLMLRITDLLTPLHRNEHSSSQLMPYSHRNDLKMQSKSFKCVFVGNGIYTHCESLKWFSFIEVF